MNNWKKYMLAAVMLTVAGFAYLNNFHRDVASDLRDAPGEVFDLEKIKAANITGGMQTSNDGKGGLVAVRPFRDVEWVAIKGGTFAMGSNDASSFKGRDISDEGESSAPAPSVSSPIHDVSIKNFYMSKTLVTVEQYEECVNASQCTAPGPASRCNWGKPDRKLHPINCVSWAQANQYARFKDGRLPTEAEWEYAARSGGNNQKYPWGNGEPDCDVVAMYGCSGNRTMPVCSVPAGNTAQGLCDMAGNVNQWVQDKFQDSYRGAPVDGSAFEAAGLPVIRGGSFLDSETRRLRVYFRREAPNDISGTTGFRLAKSR